MCKLVIVTACMIMAQAHEQKNKTKKNLRSAIVLCSADMSTNEANEVVRGEVTGLFWKRRNKDILFIINTYKLYIIIYIYYFFRWIHG